MKNKKSLALVVAFLATCAIYACFLNSISAQTIDPKTIDPQISDDAIGVRIIPNPNHYSVYRWYESQGFQGSPQALTVDGYEALRDGRTVYVNAANINVDTKKIYTNIYLISYNQNPSIKTVDILGQIISHWKFNENLSSTAATCSISAVKCEKDSDCSSGQTCSVANGNCALKTVKNCAIDTDCPANFFCDSLKSKVIRDLKRVGKLEEIREALAVYKSVNGRYPLLSGGTYLPGKTTSLWPSWNDVLMPALAIKQTFTDPINRFGNCPGYDLKTCWNKSTNRFVYDPISATLKLPRDSYALVYSTSETGSEYNLCAVMESRDNPDSSLIYTLDPNPPSASDCVMATGILASGNASNSAPKIMGVQLKGVSDREYNGYIRAEDSDGDPLSWTMRSVSSVWSNWSATPIMKMTSDNNQRKIFADKAGDVGKYDVNITVADNKGASISTTTEIEIVPATSFAQADEYTYRLDPLIPFNYSLSISGNNYILKPLSGPDVFKMNGIKETIISDGLNHKKITYQGIIATSTKFTADTETVYSLIVDGKAANNFVIRLQVDKPALKLDCLSQSRVGYYYSCRVGLVKQGNQAITYSYSSVPGLETRVGITDPEFLYLAGTTTQQTTGQEIKFNAFNEYGTVATSSFILKVNNYCGDGIKQPSNTNPSPNTEGRGGVYNDGHEACDGTADTTTDPKLSNKNKQYACNTTTIAKTPNPIISSSYCIFKSPLDGGGYCGDTYCELLFENKDTCAEDCDPSVYLNNIGGTTTSTVPVLPPGGGGGNCEGFICDPGYQCSSMGQCEKQCWSKPVSDLLVVEEGDAVLPNVTYYSHWNNADGSNWKHREYSTSILTDTSASSIKTCIQPVGSNNHSSVEVDPSPASGCTVVRRDNPECNLSSHAVDNCPIGYRSYAHIQDWDEKQSVVGGYGGDCAVDQSIGVKYRERYNIECYSNILKTFCYQDDCSSTGTKTNDGSIDVNGNCVKKPPTQYCNVTTDCLPGKTCVGAVTGCTQKTNANKPTNGPECSQLNSGGQNVCANASASSNNGVAYCEWKVITQGTCVDNNTGSCTPSCPTNYCGDNGCGGICSCSNSAYSCTNNQCVINTNPPPTSCEIGSYIAIELGVCATCPVGFSCSDGITAKKCDPGTYTSTTGNSSCKQCDAGYYCVGMASKIGCAAGTFRKEISGISQGNCTKCPAGTYNNTTGNTSCMDCEAGTYNTTEGNTSCKQCDAGYYCTGKTNKTACSAGYYRSGTGGTNINSCSECEAGTYNTTTANTSCKQCDAGHYCTGKTNKTACDPGYYRSGTGGTNINSCSECGSGTYNNSYGNTSCDSCNPGYYCTGGSNIDPCPVGTYLNSYGGDDSGSCKGCSAGTYNNTTGQSGCKTCETNFFCTGYNSRVACSSIDGGKKPYSSSGSDSSDDCHK
ncbi:MAG: hypothetical protein WCT50_03540 [Patescibacteria group bacterium]